MIILGLDGCCHWSRNRYAYLLSSSGPIMVIVIIGHVRSGNASQPDFNQKALHSKKTLICSELNLVDICF